MAHPMVVRLEALSRALDLPHTLTPEQIEEPVSVHAWYLLHSYLCEQRGQWRGPGSWHKSQGYYIWWYPFAGDPEDIKVTASEKFLGISGYNDIHVEVCRLSCSMDVNLIWVWGLWVTDPDAANLNHRFFRTLRRLNEELEGQVEQDLISPSPIPLENLFRQEHSEKGI